MPMTQHDLAVKNFDELHGLAEIWNKLDELNGSMAEVAEGSSGSLGDAVSVTISPTVNNRIVVREVYMTYSPVVTGLQLGSVTATVGGTSKVLRKALEASVPFASWSTPIAADADEDVVLDLPGVALLTGHVWAIYNDLPPIPN